METTRNEELSLNAVPEQIKALQLEKAFSFFMVPFYYEQENEFSEGGLWKLDKEKISNEGEDGDVLYSHIMAFLQGQVNQSSEVKEHLVIYKLNINKKSAWYTDFWNPFINHANVAYIPIGKNEAKEEQVNPVTFKVLSCDEQGFKAPHIFIFKAAKIGVLTFCVELAGKKKNIGDLKLLNYHLHKIYHPTCYCVCPSLCINEKRRFKDESEKSAVEINLRKIREYIPPYDESEEYSPYKNFTWDMAGLVNLFLQDIKCHLFSNIRMHVFTYCQIDDSREDCITKDEIMPDLLRLSRCVSDKYMLPFAELEKNGATLQSFDNIYCASSVEGTAIIAIAKKANKGFVSQLDGNVRLRYLWIYMLAIIQRYTLLYMNRQLTIVASENNEHKLWNLIKTIKEVKIRCYYTDVSPYTQHSQFYQLCCKNLHIREAFNEIDEKTKALNMTISHDMQSLLKLQNDAFVVSERKAESGQRRLNLVVGILTVFQVAGVIYEFTNYTDYQEWLTSVTFIIGFLLLFFVMKWEHKENVIIRIVRGIFRLGRKGKID